MGDNLSLRAVRLWMHWGALLSKAGGVEGLTAIAARHPVQWVAIALRWQADRQLGFKLEARFVKATPVELDLDGTKTQIAAGQRLNLGLDGCDGAFAGVSGKTFELTVWHDDKGPAVARAFAESAFMKHAERYAPHLKVRAMNYGFDAQAGLLSMVSGECLIQDDDWFPTLQALGLRCFDEAGGGVEIAGMEDLDDRDRGRILEAQGLVWREEHGTGRFRGGHPQAELEVQWGWPERKIKGRARGG